MPKTIGSSRDKVSSTTCSCPSDRFGISDWGADGIIGSACTLTANHQAGGGDTVSYTELSLIDTAANWLTDGHRGKWVIAGAQQAIVMANSATELTLAPVRPGATTAWREGIPPPGARTGCPPPPT
jgi:hypothetical protein